MKYKILTLFFTLLVVSSYGQELDSMVIIKDYFRKGQALKRNTSYGNKRDSVVYKGPMYPRKMFMIYEKKLLFITVSKKYRIDSELDVPKERYCREKIAYEKRFYTPFVRVQYYKDGTLYSKGTFITDACIDTCSSYYPNGKLKSVTINDCEVTEPYYECWGGRSIHWITRKDEYYNEDGNLEKVIIDDIMRKKRTREYYENGKLVNIEEDKLKFNYN